MFTLHFAKKTIALAPHIALEETGADYDTVAINFASAGQRSPDFLAINPKGRVPALVTQEGILTETHAILCHIARSLPQAQLLPSDPFQLAQVESFNLYLATTVHVNHAHGMRGARWSDDEDAHKSMRAKVPQTMSESAAMIETEYLTGPWVMGDQYTICDPYLFAITSWMPGDGVDLSAFPKLTAHHQNMLGRDAVKRALKHHS